VVSGFLLATWVQEVGGSNPLTLTW